MIQKTYKLMVKPGDDLSIIKREFCELVDSMRRSDLYEQASCVYVKLLAGNVPVADADFLWWQVAETMPKAEVAGMSLTLTIEETNDVFVKVSFCFFEHGKVTVFTHNGAPENFAQDGRQLGQKIANMDNVKAVEMFCVVVNVDIAPFVNALTESNFAVPFFGSLAGIAKKSEVLTSSEETFDQEHIKIIYDKCRPFDCYIFGNGLYENGMIMVVYSGADLHIQVDSLLGWKPLGKYMTVTKSINTVCVATIDEIPATEIYRKYLGVQPDERFLLNICEFPMILERNGFTIARTPPVFDEEGKLYFIADVHEGEKFRLSYANHHELLNETREASARMEHFCPQGIFLIICPNRPVFLGEDAHEEVAAYKHFNPELMESYGPGEIYYYQGQGGVLNSSMLAVGIREGDKAQDTAYQALPPIAEDANKSIPLATRLAAFLDATTHELQKLADAADAANEAKSNFLSNMSHEIRTPVNAILGMDEMILRESTEETVLEYADNIRLAGSNLLGLINDILDFSKIESGKMDIIPVEYSLSSVINDLVNMTQSRAEKKELSFAVNAVPDLPSILYGDEIRIKQVATNILTNAVKYTERGFVALFVTYDKKDTDTILLHVSVKDSGIGIKEEDLKKLFTAFTRIEEKRNRTIEGTGLGMNITRRLLSLMNSQLNVDSIYGKGSTFSFTLEQKVVDWSPMGNFEEAHHSAFNQRNEYRRSFAAPKAKVLVVDDTPMNLTVFKGLLKQTKLQIQTALSGYECLDMVKKEHYDIIFLDHRMPKLDGVETLKRMTTLEGNLNLDTPVISLTANAISGAREQYLAAGFKDYLTKPINGQQLENMLQKYLPPSLVVCADEEDIKTAPSKTQATLPAWLKEVAGLDVTSGIENCGST